MIELFVVYKLAVTGELSGRKQNYKSEIFTGPWQKQILTF
ncbi:hypothetical protein LEP1GSC062_4445 [Leptospira alexanderi serovar Manhao 3 str. L 60]|uniref:Uncharacterized protein n=1 Tax=Leptospira alexanderi serovar Manhao 3 str. L 60 TaxID=1049759 RepID=V6IFX7_9LEPT|nr:hypothetical protein LEP1GSC062_4445 [Leptospira alexanderi serovar Manhao 3 str. L 60]